VALQARYDGHADWYDTTFRSYSDEQGPAGMLARLLGPADPHDPICLDIGCGTGLHFEAVRAQGYVVIGIDISADQLRIAASRNHLLIQADGHHLPLADASVPAVIMTFTHTDVNSFPAVIGEAARVLRPGGRLVYLGTHPAYVGAFLDRRTEIADQELRIKPGYGNEELHHDPTGTFPMRSRVGARYPTLATFLGAFLAQPRLRLASVAELDTCMQPWQPVPSDGRIIPWNIAITAQAIG